MIPDYVVTPKRIHRCNTLVLCIHLDDPDESSFIDLDYMRLNAVVDGHDVLLYSDDYSSYGRPEEKR